MQDIRIAKVNMRSIVGNAERNIGVIVQFVVEAASRDVDIVCFPELGINGYNAGDTSNPEPEPIPGPGTDRLSEIAAGAGITFLAGLLERDESGIVYNTLIVLTPAVSETSTVRRMCRWLRLGRGVTAVICRCSITRRRGLASKSATTRTFRR